MVSVVDHHAGEDHCGDDEVHELGRDSRERQDEAREVDLRDDGLVGDEHAARVGQCIGKELPEEKSGVDEYRIRNSVRRDLEQLPEEDREHDHCYEWLKDCPENTDRGLLVADLEIAPGEEIEKFSLVPDLPDVGKAEKFLGFYDDAFLGAHKGRIAF